MGIVSEDIQAVREAADIVAVVSQYSQVRRVGSRFVAICPFHDETDGSFSINAEQGLYYCFGCQAKGDVITFVREIEHLDFVGAVEYLAAKIGFTLRYSDEGEAASQKYRKSLIAVMDEAVNWYHDMLMRSPSAGAARSYLRSRGFTKETVEEFRLGWAPDDWDQLARHLKVSEKVLRDTGLGFVNRAKRQQDAFRGRVMFPIFSANGEPIAFGGRILPQAEGAKYINSADSVIYSKSNTLYGLNWAKADAVNSNQVIICEGYTDVIAFHEIGLKQAVATCGTALTETHVQVLQKYARQVVLAFDADAAGQAAAERFYGWEQKFKVDVAVAALPKGVDPADLARNDPERLREAVDNAQPFLGFRVERLLAASNLRTPEGRARAAESAVGIIGEHPNRLVRDQYLMIVADRCRIDGDQIRAMAQRLANGSSSRARSGSHPEANRGRPARDTNNLVVRDTPELEALRLLVHRRHELLPLLDPCLFGDSVFGSALAAVWENDDLHAAITKADPDTAAVLQRVAVEESTADADDVLTLLVSAATEAQLRLLEAEMRQAADPLPYSGIIRWLRLNSMELRDGGTKDEARQSLLDWLKRRAAGEA